MKISKKIKDKIRKLHKLRIDSCKLDLEIRDYLERKRLIDNLGNGKNGFEMDLYIDIIEYATGSAETVIQMLENI